MLPCVLQSKKRRKRRTAAGRYGVYGLLFLLFVLFVKSYAPAASLLLPMDNKQSNHLRAYGLTFQALKNGYKVRWLLNYRGGAFLLPDSKALRSRAVFLGVSARPITEGQYQRMQAAMQEGNMHEVLLEKAPELAVYAPPDNEPWDDAVTLVLKYAKIPYTRIYDKEVLSGELSRYDWLHIHHEDFTGQYGKFHRYYHRKPWYIKRKLRFQKQARAAGYKTVAAHKLAVAEHIQQYVHEGGFLFAMCSATETIDVALAAKGLDIIPSEIDGTGISPNVQKRLEYSHCFAFCDFSLILDANTYGHSNIDVDVRKEGLAHNPDSFDLFQFSARIDPVPTMLVQNHENTIKGFLGQTTAYRRETIKKRITILGYTPKTDRVKYIHGTLGKGSFSFYAGHDPEDYRHLVGDPPTNLDLYKNSPGYRLILNNVLFPVAEKQEKKT